MVKKWRGILELSIDVEAETEEEAAEMMRQKLISELKEKEYEFIVWETT